MPFPITFCIPYVDRASRCLIIAQRSW
jgi:hypothetical protein